MKLLFWGFFFIFFNFNFNINQYSLNVLPDFVGYILLFQGAKALEAESRYFKNAQPFAVGMAVYTAVLWVGALLGMEGGSESQQILTNILGLISTIVALYVSWVLVQGVLEAEVARGESIGGRAIYQRWKALAVIRVLGVVIGILVDLANIAVLLMLSVPLLIVGLIVNVLYLIAWWRTAKAYEAPSQGCGFTEGE